MGKSMVLKDRMNCPGGYMLVMKDCAICRAQAGGILQAVLLFADGTQRAFELNGAAEHRFLLDGKEPIGCCVISGNDVLLSSGEEVRREYVRQILLPKRREAERQAVDACDCKQSGIKGACCECGENCQRISDYENEIGTVGCEEKDEGDSHGRSKGENVYCNLDDLKERGFAQRRWPPPPCWEKACYADGRWQEKDAIGK